MKLLKLWTALSLVLPCLAPAQTTKPAGRATSKPSLRTGIEAPEDEELSAEDKKSYQHDLANARKEILPGAAALRREISANAARVDRQYVNNREEAIKDLSRHQSERDAARARRQHATADAENKSMRSSASQIDSARSSMQRERASLMAEKQKLSLLESAYAAIREYCVNSKYRQYAKADVCRKHATTSLKSASQLTASSHLSQLSSLALSVQSEYSKIDTSGVEVKLEATRDSFANAIKMRQVLVGMTREQVLAAWGEPISKTEKSWTYEPKLGQIAAQAMASGVSTSQPSARRRVVSFNPAGTVSSISQ